METRKRSFRAALHEIIFEAETPTGRIFDIILIISITLSVIAVMLDSIKAVRIKYGELLYSIEWFFTILFSIEYLIRLYAVEKPLKYAKSFYGVIDLLAIVPTYLSILFPGSQYFLVIRILRVLRVFRVLKFVQYMGEASVLKKALIASRKKITVFILTVLTLVVILGSLMYLIEGEESGFTSIPQSIYWAIVTLTTVGYGDLSPVTPLGKILAAMIMIVGYGIIAVPTGIVTAEMTHLKSSYSNTQSCPSCSAEGHDRNAKFCKFCGAQL